VLSPPVCTSRSLFPIQVIPILTPPTHGCPVTLSDGQDLPGLVDRRIPGHRQVSSFCCPTRISSWDQISRSVPDASSSVRYFCSSGRSGYASSPCWNTPPFAVPADRPKCRARPCRSHRYSFAGAPDWLFGGGGPYSANHGKFSVKWLDGKDNGVRVTVATNDPNYPLPWRIDIAGGRLTGKAKHATATPMPDRAPWRSIEPLARLGD
jgi:hypothetical protein